MIPDIIKDCDKNAAKTEEASISPQDVFHTIKNSVKNIDTEYISVANKGNINSAIRFDVYSPRNKVDLLRQVSLKRKFFIDKYNIVCENLPNLVLSKYNNTIKFQLEGLQPTEDFIGNIYVRVLMKQEYVPSGLRRKVNSRPIGSRIYTKVKNFKSLGKINILDKTYFDKFYMPKTSIGQQVTLDRSHPLNMYRHQEHYKFAFTLSKPTILNKFFYEKKLFVDKSKSTVPKNNFYFRYTGVRGKRYCILSSEPDAYVEKKTNALFKFQLMLYIRDRNTFIPLSNPSNELLLTFYYKDENSKIVTPELYSRFVGEIIRGENSMLYTKNGTLSDRLHFAYRIK